MSVLKDLESIEWTFIDFFSSIKTNHFYFSFSNFTLELFSSELSEPPLSTNKDLLSSWELSACLFESQLSNMDIFSLNSNRNKRITNSNSTYFAITFAPSSSHSLLKSISTSTTQHLIDSDNMPRMYSDP